MAPTRNPADTVRHVVHEIERCANAAQARVLAELGVGVAYTYRKLYVVLAFEDCLLHARNLIEFFIPSTWQGSHSNDIRAVDLVDDWECPKDDDRAFLEKQLPELDLHLAHLTWHRVENPPNDSERPYWRIAKTLVLVAERFAARAEEQRKPWADELASGAENARHALETVAPQVRGNATLETATTSPAVVSVWPPRV